MGDLESRLRDELRRERDRFRPSPELAERIDARIRRHRRQQVGLLATAASVMAALAAGAALLAGGDGSGRTEVGERPPSPTTSASTTAGTEPPAVTDLDVVGVTGPDGTGDSRDACGETTGFDPAQMVDGAGDTAWRMTGDGTGEVITLDLGAEREVTEVAIVPGYAKVDACDGTDRFRQNRRPTEVTWRFDDGTEVSQVLNDTGELQTAPLEPPRRTATIELRIDAVSPLPPDQDPARPATYDNTAISEVVVRGR